MRGRTVRVTFGLVTLAAVVTVPLPIHSASAACATSLLQFEDGRTSPNIARGETVTLFANGYVEGCGDGGDANFGCGSPKWEEPRRDVVLTLRQRGAGRALETADARKEGDEFGHISWTVTIPDDIEAGTATLVPDGGEPLQVQIVNP